MTKIKGQIYVPNKDNPVSEEDYDLILPQTTIDMVEGKATKEDAEVGTDDIKFMSPLRVWDAIKKYMITFLATAVFTGIVKAVAPDADSNDNSVPTTSWVKTLMNTAVKTYIVEDYLMAQTGYIKFGAWLGHLILQWGKISNNKAIFPLIFNIFVSSALLLNRGPGTGTWYGDSSNTTLTGISCVTPDYVLNGTYIAIGA